MRILVTGASGLIGKNFIRHALKQGHEIVALVRSPEKFRMLPKSNVFKWSYEYEPDQAAFNQVDAVVHLAGENIADKSWTETRKKQLAESRLIGTKNIVAALSRRTGSNRPKVLVSGSAIGIYGYHPEGPVDESSSIGIDFLANLCADWEREALKAEDLGVRVVLARTGIVLSKEGGALTKMPPIQVSSGENWMSWIHIDDMVQALLFALKNDSVFGPINCVSPEPVQSREFVSEMAKQAGVPKVGFVPRIFIDVALGEVAKVVLSSQRVVPTILLSAGFVFKHPDIRSALSKEMGGRSLLDSVLIQDQFVPLRPDEVFPFFSRAENLESLTPDWLNFKIVSKSTNEITKGTLIDYKLKVHGFPVKWRTLISEWKPGEFFIDDQLKGPYSKWHHLHSFDLVPGGCLLRDEVTYRVPGSIFGKLALSKWISSDVNKIFAYRQEKIQQFLESGKLK